MTIQDRPIAEPLETLQAMIAASATFAAAVAASPTPPADPADRVFWFSHRTTLGETKPVRPFAVIWQSDLVIEYPEIGYRCPVFDLIVKIEQDAAELGDTAHQANAVLAAEQFGSIVSELADLAETNFPGVTQQIVVSEPLTRVTAKQQNITEYDFWLIELTLSINLQQEQ